MYTFERKGFPTQMVLFAFFIYVISIFFILVELRPSSNSRKQQAPNFPHNPTKEEFERLFHQGAGLYKSEDPFENLSLVLHRNGEPEPCSENTSTESVLDAFLRSSRLFRHSPDHFDRYDTGSILTHAFATSLLSANECGPKTSFTSRRFSFLKDTEIATSDFLYFCDKGNERTQILPDHDKLVNVPEINGYRALPCHFHTREGVRIKSLKQLANLAKSIAENISVQSSQQELHLYAVPASAHFMFAPSYIGEIFELPHVKSSNGLPVSLEVLLLKPRVFDVRNILSADEAASIIQGANTKDVFSHSTVVDGDTFNSRVSDTSFYESKLTKDLQRRSISILGIEYEQFVESPQVTRYKDGGYYIGHLDAFEENHVHGDHNFSSSKQGSNRMASFKFYLNDVPEEFGGRMVFNKALPNSSISETSYFSPKIESLNLVCKTKFTIQPHAARTIMFYDQHPDGKLDNYSLHADCPLVSGEKWVADMWIWNGPLAGHQQNAHSSLSPNSAPSNFKQNKVLFQNSGVNRKFDRAELYWEDTFFAPLRRDDSSITVNTREGDRWNVRVDGEVVKNLIVDKSTRIFTL